MRYYLKYYLYRYVNRKHSWLEKKLLIGVAQLVILTCSLPNSLARQLRDEILNDEFKLVGRRLSWMISNSWLRLQFVNDDYFDFSIGLKTNVALDTYRYLHAKSSGINEIVAEIQLAQMASAVMESQVEPGDTRRVDSLKFSEFDRFFSSHIANALRLLKQKKIAENKSDQAKSDNRVKAVVVASKRNLLRKHAGTSLEQALAVFASIGIQVFAISGTFLGLIREKDFIAHDYDIDIGLFAEDYDPVLISAFESFDDFLGVKVDWPCFRTETLHGVEYSRGNVPALLKLIHNSGLQIDIFIHFTEEKAVWHGSSLHRWDNSRFELVEYDFLDLRILGPSNYDRYLTENYGDWRTPVSDFNCSTGTPNSANSLSCKNTCFQLKRRYLAQN